MYKGFSLYNLVKLFALNSANTQRLLKVSHCLVFFILNPHFLTEILKCHFTR